VSRRNRKHDRHRRERRHRRSALGGRSQGGPTVKPPPGYSTPVIHNFSFDNPFAGLSDESRRELLHALATNAAARLEESQLELKEIIKHVNPLELLATAAFYSMKVIGPDAELTDDGPYPQAVAELLQSLVLGTPTDELGDQSILQSDFGRCIEAAKSCLETLELKPLGELAEAEDGTKDILMMREGARMFTRSVRNWGYPQHMRQIIRAMFDPLETAIIETSGFSISDMLQFFDNLTDAICDRVDKLRQTIAIGMCRKTLRETLKAWCEALGEPQENADLFLAQLRSLKRPVDQLRSFAVAFFHRFFPRCFTFDADELVAIFPHNLTRPKLTSLIDRLSLRFGELSADRFEHLATQSPIRLRPFIAVANESHFIPIPGLLNSFSLEIAENFVKENQSLWDRYLERRSKYLEATIRDLFANAFPEAIVESNIVWDDPVSGKRFETDVIVVLGPLALLIEAKSSRVSDSARRGGELRLKREFERLVDQPAEQATRIASALEKAEQRFTFYRQSGDSFTVPAGGIHRSVCLSITLDSLPGPTLCWTSLLKAGLVDPARRPTITMSLADLIVVLDALENPSVRLHYFWRRSEWEKRVEYVGDEEDVLVYYLSNALPDIGPQGDEKPIQLMLIGNSDEMRRYYMATWYDPDATVPRPRRLMTPWWHELIDRIQQLDRPEKWEIACCLLDVGYELQRKVEEGVDRVIAFVRRYGNTVADDAIVIRCPTTESACAVVIFAYRDLSLKDRNAFAQNLINQCFERHSVRRIVLIGRDVQRNGRPYDFMLFSDRDRPMTASALQ
jgi:hypothetical protein